MRAIILTRNKRAIIKRVNSKSNDWEFRKATYILEPSRVQNYRKIDKNKISGSELIFFEENPNPVNHEEKPNDLSSAYLEDVVIINFIQQTTNTFGKWEGGTGIWTWLGANLSRIPYFVMIGFVAWTLAKNYFAGGSF